MKRKTILMIGAMATLTSSALAGDSTSLWSRIDTGLSCGIVVGATNVRTAETVSITFVVSNSTQQAVSVPVPDTGTLSFNTVVTDTNRDLVGFDGHMALAADPGRPDIWRDLASGKSLTYSFSFAWRQTGSYDVYFRYHTRFADHPFKPMETQRVRITVIN